MYTEIYASHLADIGVSLADGERAHAGGDGVGLEVGAVLVRSRAATQRNWN